jgi:signal transduction histidine kinase
VLAYRSGDAPAPAQSVRERLGAQSLMVAPITGGEFTLGWFVAATGPYRRGFRQSALRIGVELSSRMGATIGRVGLLRDMQAAAREQTRAARRLRRLATAATNLAGAAGTEAVLRIACVEACLIQEADGAIARWWRADGSLVSAQTGEVDLARGEKAFAAVANERAARGRGWIAHSLPTSDPWQRAALVVFLGKELSEDEELVLTSLVSLVPVAFERALGTEAVVAHDSRLRAVVEASPVALIGVRSDDGAVGLANRAALALFGWGPDPEGWVLGEPLRPDVLELAQAVQSSGAVVTRTASIAGYDLSLSGAPLPPTAGPDDHTVLIAGLDLSQVRRAERTLAQAQRLEVVESAAGRLAHDFNNLLTLIIGYSELLGRGLSDPHLRDLADGIAEAARRGTDLTEQMAGVSRGVDGGAVADLAAEVRGLGAVLTRLAGPDVTLRIVAPDHPVKVRMEPGEVEQIVINLVMNACEAIEARGAVDVRVEAPADAGAVLAVSGRAQAPFFVTQAQGHGSGLGLSTVLGLVTDRGGRIDLDSTPGSGTLVRIWLPPCEEEAAPLPDPGVSHWPLERRLIGRILLVEDEPALRATAERALVGAGVDVVAVESAERALSMLAVDRSFDALVTDIMLPGLTGVQLAQAARRARPDLRVLYMTGYTGVPDASRTPAAGEPVLRKPYHPDELIQMVADLLGEPRVGGPPVVQGSKR